MPDRRSTEPIVADPIVSLPPPLLDATTPPAWWGNMRTWVAHSYADVEWLLNAPPTKVSAEFVDPYGHPAFAFMWAADPPRHDTLRDASQDQFSAPLLRERMAPLIREVAAALLDVEAVDGRLDVARWTLRVANQTACGLLGIDADVEEERIDRWLREAGDAETQPQAPNGPEITEWAMELIKLRRHSAASLGWAGPGLLGHLIGLQQAGYELTDNDLVGYIWGMLTAGTVSTGAQFASAVLHLTGRGMLPHLSWAATDRRLAVREVFRYDPAFPMTRRTAVVELHLPSGAVIPAGDPVTACLSSANRDETVFDRPHDLVLDRTPNPYLTFGRGLHNCEGAPLALLVTEIGLEVLASRLPTLRIDPTVPVARKLGIVNRFESAWLRYDA